MRRPQVEEAQDGHVADQADREFPSSQTSERTSSGRTRRQCTDTPGWKNPKWGCDKYKQKGWCKDGKVRQKWTVGARFRFPEKNCCVCGKGATPAPAPAGDSLVRRFGRPHSACALAIAPQQLAQD